MNLTPASLNEYAKCVASHAAAMEFIQKVFCKFPAYAVEICNPYGTLTHAATLPDGRTVTIPGEFMPEIIRLLKNSTWVEAIKECRARTGFSLYEARWALESLRQFHTPRS